jgi:hypothetical protein
MFSSPPRKRSSSNFFFNSHSITEEPAVQSSGDSGCSNDFLHSRNVHKIIQPLLGGGRRSSMDGAFGPAGQLTWGSEGRALVFFHDCDDSSSSSSRQAATAASRRSRARPRHGTESSRSGRRPSRRALDVASQLPPSPLSRKEASVEI